MAYWRVAIMGVILILLGIAIATAYQAPSGFMNIPVLCFLKGGIEGFRIDYSCVTIPVLLTYLFSSYITRVVRLFNTLSRQTHKWLRTKPGNLLKKIHRYAASRQAKVAGLAGKTLWRTCKISLTFLYVVFKILYEVGDSTLWEVSAPYVDISLVYLDQP